MIFSLLMTTNTKTYMCMPFLFCLCATRAIKAALIFSQQQYCCMSYKIYNTCIYSTIYTLFNILSDHHNK